MRTGGQVITLSFFVHISEAVHFILFTLFTDPFALIRDVIPRILK